MWWGTVRLQGRGSEGTCGVYRLPSLCPLRSLSDRIQSLGSGLASGEPCVCK